MDGFNQVIRVPGDNNPNPRGMGDDAAQPVGGLRSYQDDLDTTKEDVATEEVTDDPSKVKVAETPHAPVMTPDDLQAEIEDRDEGSQTDR